MFFKRRSGMNTIAIRSLFLFLVFTLAHIAPAAAATYYVSPNGTATWAQATNINTPTNGRTAMQNAVAGDIVYFRGGTYTPSASPMPLLTDAYWCPCWYPVNSGNAMQPITFKAYPGESPVLIHYSNGPVIGSYRSNYIIIDGFHGEKINAHSFIHIGGDGVYTQGCVIQNCRIKGYSWESHDNNRCILGRYARNLTVRNNYFYDASGPTQNTCAVQFYWVQNSIVENNTFYNLTCGIHDKQNCYDNIHRYNFFHDCKFPILLNNDQKRHKVYQNIMVGSKLFCAIETGYDVSLWDWRGDSHQIYNNTIVSPSAGGLTLHQTNEQQWNNIIINVGGIVYRSQVNCCGDGQPTYMDYNCYYNGQTFRIKHGGSGAKQYASFSAWQNSGSLMGGGNPDTHSIYANPLFVNAGGATPTDYKLQANSPCRNAGRDGETMGAYIIGNEVIGYVGSGISTTTTSIDITPPAPPTGLRIIE